MFFYTLIFLIEDIWSDKIHFTIISVMHTEMLNVYSDIMDDMNDVDKEK